MISDSRDREKTEKIESMTKKMSSEMLGGKTEVFPKNRKKIILWPRNVSAQTPRQVSDNVIYHIKKYLTINTSFIHSFIHSFILNIYIAPLQENYLEALPTPARSNKAVLR